jgi:hypothetical protein
LPGRQATSSIGLKHIQVKGAQSFDVAAQPLGELVVGVAFRAPDGLGEGAQGLAIGVKLH